MPDTDKMQRVSRSNPCPVCDKPDWCLVAKDGSAAICARIEDGSVKRCGDAGNLHILHGDGYRQRNFSKRIVVDTGTDGTKDFEPLTKQYQDQLTVGKLNTLAVSLAVSTQSLKRLRVGWDGEAYTFPMSDADGKIIGIRRRFPSGRKISVTGTKNGLFIPWDLRGDKPLLIVEGESDLAAALDLGFDAIGRPNCNSRIEMTIKIAKGRTQMINIADADTPGRTGAEKLAYALVLYYPCVKIIYPPDNVKDLREWLQTGLNSETLQRIIKETKPIEIVISTADSTEA